MPNCLKCNKELDLFKSCDIIVSNNNRILVESECGECGSWTEIEFYNPVVIRLAPAMTEDVPLDYTTLDDDDEDDALSPTEEES